MKLGSCIHLKELRSTPLFNFETWPTFHGSLTNVEFLRLGHFLGNNKGLSHETWVMHTAWTGKGNPTFNFESWPTFCCSLTLQLFVKFWYLRYLTMFLRNCKSNSHKIWIRRAFWRGKVNPTSVNSIDILFKVSWLVSFQPSVQFSSVSQEL